MKKLITITGLVTLFLFPVFYGFAENDSSFQNTNYDYYVPDYTEIKFELEKQEQGKVQFEWRKANEKDFSYYKLVFSSENETPKYPHDKTMHVGENIDEIRTQVWAKNGYYGLCHVYKGFYENDEDETYVVCSNSVYIESNEQEENKKIEYHNKSGKDYSKNTKQEKKYPHLSKAVVEKFKTLIQEKLFAKLDSYEKDAKIEYLEKLQSALQEKIENMKNTQDLSEIQLKRLDLYQLILEMVEVELGKIETDIDALLDELLESN